MIRQGLLRIFSAVVLVPIICFGCKKIGDTGKSVVKIAGGGTPATVNTIRISHTANSVTIAIAEIRRETANASQLNQELTVRVKDNSVAVTTADPSFTVFPDSLYTVSTETPKTGGFYTVILKPGEFSKSIRIIIPNPTLLSPLKKYALGFTIESAEPNVDVSDQNSVVARITTNNQWDGVYLNIGNTAAPGNGFRDIIDPTLSWYGNQQYSLITLSDTSCIVVNDDLSIVSGGIYLWPGYMIRNNGIGITSSYGSYGIIVCFDTLTNKISSIHNSYADTSFMRSWAWPGNFDWALGAYCITGAPVYATCNTRRAILDPSGINAKLPNKDIVIKHFMLQPNVVPATPNIRCYFDETWQYLRPR